MHLHVILDIDTMITTNITAKTDAVSKILGKERIRKKHWITKDLFDLCDKRRDLKKKRNEAEGAKLKHTGKLTTGFRRR